MKEIKKDKKRNPDLYKGKEERIKAISLLFQITLGRNIEITDRIYDSYSTMTYAQIIAPAIIALKNAGKKPQEIAIRLRTNSVIVRYHKDRYIAIAKNNNKGM